jgi:ribosome-associated protein
VSSRSPASDTDRLDRAALVVEAALARKAEDVVALDVREVTSFADTFVLATGRSDRQVRAIADAILEAVEARGGQALGREGYREARWILLDLGDVIVHVFQPQVRSHYDLDRLWSDAPPLELEDADRRRVER